MKKILVAIVILGVVGIVGTLVILLTDAGVSLDHSRQQNHFLAERCQLLAKVTDAGWKGQELTTLTARLGPEITVKYEGREVWLDDSVVLIVEGGKITEITASKTCD